jgi:hypothetical protein
VEHAEITEAPWIDDFLVTKAITVFFSHSLIWNFFDDSSSSKLASGLFVSCIISLQKRSRYTFHKDDLLAIKIVVNT